MQGRKPKSESQLIRKEKKKSSESAEFPEAKQSQGTRRILRMGPHRKFLSRRQKEMGIQSFLVGVRREFGFTEEPAKFKTSCPGSEIKLFDSGENSCRERILIYKKPPVRLENEPEE